MMKLFPKNHLGLLALCLALLLAALSTEAQAAARPFSTRFTANTNGNLTQIGNTIMTCSTCTVINNTSTMINFDGDTDTSTFNSSSANLTIPSGSTVLWAGLYWGARSASTSIGQVLFKTPNSFGYSSVTASQLDTAVGGQANEYGGFADVTNLVSAGGSGTYWVGNIQTTTGGGGVWGGWSLIVAYANNNELLNNITVFDGYQVINSATGVTMNVSGFLTPLSGPVVSRVGLVGWDGDDGAGGATYTGDQFLVNGTSLYDNCNPISNDFFNSTVCNLGVPNEARYPNTATYPAGMVNTLGVDVDLVQLASGIIPNGATSATLKFTTNGESFGAHAAAFVTNLYVPIVTPNVVKTATDVNGGDLMIGDVLRYTISLSNTGQDTATNVILTDNIPPYTTYVPNSLNIVSGPNAGAKTDASGDDQAEYIATGTPHVVFRLGTGATSAVGGSLPFYNPPPAQTSLTFDVTVNSNIPTGTLLSNSASISLQGQTLPGNTYTTTSSAAVAYVLTPAVISKSFSPNTINVNGVAQLRIVVSNPASNPSAINGVTFSDSYPAGLVNATPANPTILCTSGSTAGTLTGGVAGGSAIGMSPGATLAAGGSCTITVNVTSGTAGNYTNTTSATNSTNAGSGSPSTSVLSVGKPSISKAFASNPILAGASSRLTLTVSNGLATGLTGVAFTDTYPAGLVNATVPNVTTTCGGTVTATAGANVVSLAAGNVAAGTNCTVSVDVTSNSAGVYANTSGGVSATESGVAGSGSNTASLTVIGPPQAVKTFSPISTRISLDTQLIITISNPNTTTALTGVAFTDTYPVNLLNTIAPNPTLNCTAGSTATRTGGVASGSTIGISGGSLAPSGSCIVIVNVSSAIAGNYTNSTGLIVSANGGTGAGATATLNVSNLTAPTVAKAFAPVSINTNGTSVLTITLANANAGSAITNATITDTYPINLVNAAAPASSTTCGGSLTAVPGGNSVALSGGTIPAAGSCTVTVTVTSSAPGNYNNNISAGALTSANAGDNAVAAAATLTVVNPPSIAKSFTPNAVAVNTNSLLTFTLTNPNTVAALTGVGFTDTYPAGVTNNLTVVSNTCTAGGTAGTATAVNGGNSLSYATATIAANGSCTITINVRSAATGSYVNTTGTVTSTNGGTGNTASATLAVGKPGISKAFSTSPINTNGTSVLTITLSNPTAAAMTLAAFTDTYPTGMTNGATPAAATTCVLGTVTAVAGAGSVALSGGTIPANGTCTVSVTVTASNTGTNTIPVGGLTLNGVASNVNAASAILDVNPAPVVTKSFSPASIAKNGTSTLTITVQNNNNAAMTGVAFTDTYPAGLVNSATPMVTATPATCTFTTLTAAAGGNSFALTGGSIPLNTACNYTVNVTSTTEGSYLNSTGAVTSTNYGIGTAAIATLTVTPSSPTVAKAFSPATVNAGVTSVMTITLTNPNTSAAITGAAFNDIYPAGMTNTSSASAATTCVGTVTAADNGNSVQLSGATIPANSSCTVTVNVTSALGGVYTNSTGTVTTTNANSGTAASAVLTVTGPPTVAKAFATSPISSGGTSVLTITLTNPNATAALSALAFTDTYPLNITNAAVPAAATTCGGAVTAAAGGASVALSGGALAAGASCTVTVTVTGTIGGTYTNTIANGGVASSAGNSGAAAWANLTVYPPPTVTKAFSVPSVAINTNVTVTITLTNSSAVAITGAAFTDTYPGQLVNVAAGAVATTCAGGTATFTTGIGTSTLKLTGGTIPANGSCTVTYNRVQSATAGAYVNNTGSVTTTNGGTGSSASATLSVGQPTITKAFAASPIIKGATTTLTFTLGNPNGAAMTLAAFTDTYPAGITNAAAPAASTTCALGTVTAAANGGSIALSGATIPATGTCTVTVTVTGTAGGVYTNTVPIGGLTVNGGLSNGIAANAVLTVMGPPAVTKAFSPVFIGLGASSTMTITLTNPNTTTAITGAAFTDTYPANLSNSGSLVNNCGGTVTAAVSTLTLSGGTIPASGNCTISISVTSAVAGNYTNTLAIGSVTTTNSGSNALAGSASLSIQAAPSLTILKSVAVYSDPANGTTNPKYIPGAIAEYTMIASNSGGPADADSIIITDQVPPNTALYVNDIAGAGSGPVLFTQGTPSSTLTYTFTALNNMTDDISFSSNSGATWTAVPVAGANGCDTSINYIRINPKGTFIGATPNPGFQLKFRVCVQ
jgi:uncharacterized repeat protein (TIGR01451 family)